MEKAPYFYFRMASWFASQCPGTTVPEWCELSWPIQEEEVNELIERDEKEYGRKMDSRERDDGRPRTTLPSLWQ